MEPYVAVFAGLIYAVFMLTLLLCVSLQAYYTSEWKSEQTFCSTIYAMRRIYMHCIVHIYDTSTDFAVLVLWGIYAAEEQGDINHEHVDLLSFLLPSIVLIFFYRICYALYHWTVFKDSSFDSAWDLLFILLDVYIYKLVYQQFALRYLSPCFIQKKLQFLESIFESMPQCVMQSIFLIRTYETQLAQTNLIYLLWLSIAGSFFSIVMKFAYDDMEYISDDAHTFMSMPYVAVKVFRVCETIARFSIFTLLWCIVGGAFLPLYLMLDLCVYYVMETKSGRIAKRTDIKFIFRLLTSAQTVVGIPIRKNLAMHGMRFIDNALILCVLLIFAFLRFECWACYDQDLRNATNNPYILFVLVMAALCVFINFIVYLFMYNWEIVTASQTLQTVEIVGSENMTAEQRKKAMICPNLASTIPDFHRIQTPTSKNHPKEEEVKEPPLNYGMDIPRGHRVRSTIDADL